LEDALSLTVFEKDGARGLLATASVWSTWPLRGIDPPADISELLQAVQDLLDRLRELPSRAPSSTRLAHERVKA
jgi:hypothetical protein